MYYLNKAVWGVMNPTIIAWTMIAFGLLFTLRQKGIGRRTRCVWVFCAGLVVMWVWMTPLMMRILGLPLEREWLVQGRVPQVEIFPSADAIALLGGGMGGATNVSEYAEMCSNSDRPWQAARLYRAGKASKIIVSGRGNEWATKCLLVDFGVPTNALVFLDEPRNTEQEAKAIARLFEPGKRPTVLSSSFSRSKVLLVTSAWHMRRARMMFEKYASELDVVPAPTDFESTAFFAKGFSWSELLPSGQCVGANERYFHEWLGYWGYGLLR